MPKSSSKAAPVKPRPSPAKINAAIREAETALIANALRGPQKPELTREQVTRAKKGGFA